MFKPPSQILLTILLTTLFPALSANSQTGIPLVTAEFPPYNYSGENGITGSSTEIVKTVFDRMGIPVEIKIFPPKRAMLMAARGEVAGYFTFTQNPQRLDDYHFSLPLSTISDVLFVKHKDIPQWDTLADLKGYTIGATQGYNYAPVFLNAIRDKTIGVDYVVSDKPEELHLRKLMAGRIDMAICEVTLCSHLIKTHQSTFGEITYIDKPIGPVRTFHLGFSRKWPGSQALAEAFNQNLQALLDEGTIRQIHNRHGTRRALPPS